MLEEWGVGNTIKMGAGRAFYVYFILLFQGLFIFSFSLWRASVYSKSTTTRGEIIKEILEICSGHVVPEQS